LPVRTANCVLRSVDMHRGLPAAARYHRPTCIRRTSTASCGVMSAGSWPRATSAPICRGCRTWRNIRSCAGSIVATAPAPPRSCLP